MKLKIWGSGGGEGYPGLFCNCENCRKARKLGGKNIRTLSQSCIDDKLIIDLPPDTNMHLLRNQFSLGNIRDILITHAHRDHFYPSIFGDRGREFAHDMLFSKVNIYGSDMVEKCFKGSTEDFPILQDIQDNICFIHLQNFQEVKIGNYTVVSLPAEHAPQLKSLNYLILDGKTALLYLVDTGYPSEEVFSFLERYGAKIGCVAMDSTMGTSTMSIHMGFYDNIRLKEELLRRNIVDECTLFVSMHITHNHAGMQGDIEKIFKNTGIFTAYDDMKLCF